MTRKNPDMVLVDTEIVSKAPLRYLVAGIGDAMATFYEARVCYNNPKARNMLGTRITATALALAEFGLCFFFGCGRGRTPFFSLAL